MKIIFNPCNSKIQLNKIKIFIINMIIFKINNNLIKIQIIIIYNIKISKIIIKTTIIINIIKIFKNKKAIFNIFNLTETKNKKT